MALLIAGNPDYNQSSATDLATAIDFFQDEEVEIITIDAPPPTPDFECVENKQPNFARFQNDFKRRGR